MSDDEKIGVIRIKEQRIPRKGCKYLVYVRLPAPEDPDRLTELVEYAFAQYPWQPRYVETFKTKLAFPREFEIIWKAIAETEKTAIPPHKYWIQMLSDEPVDSLEAVEEHVARAFENADLVPKNQGGLYVIAKKVDLLPDEKPKTLKRIPLTMKMFKQALIKKQQEKEADPKTEASADSKKGEGE